MASYVTTLTTTLTHPLVLQYRIPSAPGEAAHPVNQVMLPARALNIEVSFPSELHYHEFKLQNEYMFVQGRVIEGKATEAQAIDMNAKQRGEITKKATEKVEKVVDKIQEMSEEKVILEVANDSATKKSSRKH